MMMMMMMMIVIINDDGATVARCWRDALALFAFSCFITKVITIYKQFAGSSQLTN